VFSGDMLITTQVKLTQENMSWDTLDSVTYGTIPTPLRHYLKAEMWVAAYAIHLNVVAVGAFGT
jgi:hypothetical protein